MAMNAYDFNGWVDSIKDGYGTEKEVVLRDHKIVGDPNIQYPSFVRFIVTQKRIGCLNGLEVDDGVKITFFVRGSKGVSAKTGNPYQINKLILNTLTITERAPRETVNTPDSAQVDDGIQDLPF